MEGPGTDDPYSWGVEDAVQQLCAPGCPWSRDPDSLAARLREEEIDGKTLLTFEHVCSRQELMECLGVKIARHKAALVELIVTLRSQSRGYWQWQQEFKRKNSSFCDEQAQELTEGTAEHAHSPSGGRQKQNEIFTPASVSNVGQHNAEERPTQQEDTSAKQIPTLQKDEQPTAVGDPRLSPTRETPNQETGERSVKRRRVAPTLLTEKPRDVAAAFIPTEADVLQYSFPGDPYPWESAPVYAYLGDGMIPQETITSPEGKLSSLVREHNESFDVNSLHMIPAGRRLVANRTLKRLFTGRHPISGHFSSSPNRSDPSDKIYELADLGAEDFDDETRREIEEEELEKERLETLSHEAGPDPFVSAERVAEILNEAIEAVEANWRERKLPKYERKAYSLWQKSRRHGIRKLQIRRAHETATHLIGRIQKLCLEIQKQDWTSESPYRDAAKSLEQSLEDKMYQTWLIKILESSRPPPKPQATTKPKPPTERRSSGFLQEEVLTSSDEDEFVVPDQADLIEEGPREHQVSPIPILKEEPMDLDATFVDLTQDDSDDHDGFDLTQPIDLITPVKKASKPWSEEMQRENEAEDVPGTVIFDGDISEPGVAETQPPENPDSESRDVEKKADSIPSKKSPYPSDSTNLELPPIENFGDLQQFALASLYKLAKSSDRWRLLIGEIWQMEHRRRKAAFDLILSDEPGVVWSKHIVPYLDAPVNDRQELEQDSFRAALFDVARLCNCFFLCQHKTDEQMLYMKPSKIKKRIMRPQSRLNIFETFSLFVKLLAPHIPQDSQIYNTQETDILDDFFPEEVDLDDGDDLDDVDGEEDRGRQRPKEKEIIRDKDAVDLREREKQRIQEQELRRAKLRATLASQPSAPGDGNRIIINESKEEDQGLIYVNEHIARSIKPHQVDGVRFMWNQIVRDASVRQGCLLAHTMGLGKTMQVITVLVALAEASESQDPSVVAQIPTDLRNSRTLVLCPASLVDNWMDELLKWAPVQALGELRKVTSSTPKRERSSTVTAWASGKGVLLVGYNMFQVLLAMSEEVSSLLTDRPDVVVCDEAHALKNDKSKIHTACSNFKTKSRIALTGSPLSNNVLEYFAMIDWVAPKFLGPYQEFREIYSIPVERGLYHDSTAYDKRRAQKVLKALEQMVTPKVHRCTIAVLKDDLPSKQEFILFVPPTEPQKQLYQLYIKGVTRGGSDKQADTFAAINHLGLICSHPKCFQAKIKKIQNGVSSSDDEEKMTDKSFPKTMIPEFMKTLQSFRDISSPAFSWKTELLTTILNEAREVNDKVLIFSQSLDTLDYLENMCNMQRRAVIRLDGKTRVGARQQQVKNFNQGSKEVFLISTTAGGVGLNIQGANRVVIFDVRYNPAHEQQAVGRAYRIGQQKKVFVYRFMVAGTFEENLNNRQVFKMQLSSRVVDRMNPISWSKRKGDVVTEIRHHPASSLDPYVGKDQILDRLIKLRENGEAIRSIVSTDTFEEEDVSATLTEEEKREVEEMIKRSQLRLSNPEEYARLKNSEGAALMEHPRLSGEQEQSSPPTSPQHAHRSFDGASDIPGDAPLPSTSSSLTHYQRDLPDTTRPPTLPSQGPAPMPMAGANTFFGEHRSRETTIAQNAKSDSGSRELAQSLPPQGLSVGSPTIMQLTNTLLNSPANRRPMSMENHGMQSYTSAVPKLNGVFSVTDIPARTDFETTLRKGIQNLQARNVPLATGDPSQLARALTRRIDQIRKEAQFGLMPDTRHWKILNGLISHEKVVAAIISGSVSSEFLARAEAKELEQRVETINGLNETEIPARAFDKVNSPDPINLQNIRRHSSHQCDRRSRATDDMKVMREAMDNRRNRAVRLPSWANEALSNEQRYRTSSVVDKPEKQHGT